MNAIIQSNDKNENTNILEKLERKLYADYLNHQKIITKCNETIEHCIEMEWYEEKELEKEKRWNSLDSIRQIQEIYEEVSDKNFETLVEKYRFEKPTKEELERKLYDNYVQQKKIIEKLKTDLEWVRRDEGEYFAISEEANMIKEQIKQREFNITQLHHGYSEETNGKQFQNVIEKYKNEKA